MKLQGLFAIFCIPFICWASESVHFEQRWTEHAQSDQANIQHLIEILQSSAKGREIVQMAEEKAKEQNEKLIQLLEVGDGSLTDTTWTRSFSAHDLSQVSYEKKSKIYINRNLSLENGVLDLAHEFTHFARKPTVNPYKDVMTLVQFIKSTIEEDGGEADAFINECQVSYELFPHKTLSDSTCQKIWDNKRQQFSRTKTVAEFYKVGEHFPVLKNKLLDLGIMQGFPLLSKEKEVFVSSAYSVPYPVAAIQEYVSMMGKACANDKKRLAMMEGQLIDRAPASERSSSRERSTWHKKFENSYRSRCAILDRKEIQF